MAATILLGTLEAILSKLVSLSVPYIQLVFCFNSEKRKLMETLSTVRAVLLDAEKQQEKNHTDEDWLEKLQDILYDAEDLVEDLSDEVQKQVHVDRRNIANKVLNFFSIRRFYVKMAFKLKTIRERLDDAAADKTKFHPVQQVVLKDENKERKEPQSYKPPTEVIGREDDKKAIKTLLKECSNENNVSIIAITGIGGVGKTTLARLVLDDADGFDLKMWVWVSSDFDVERLVKKIIEAATKTECPDLGMYLLQSLLREKLAGNKYLLVLDDVWNKNRVSWIALENLLKDAGSRGSAILVTTRERDVALIMGIDSPYELRGLYGDDCESLLKQQLGFKTKQMEENPRLLAIGEEILKKCGGIPLAIATVAGLLCCLDTESEWSNVKDQLWELAQEDNDMLPTLRVSYVHLPSHLKKCFAYCSLFPKDNEIEKATLIQLWIAQRFIQPSKNRLLEDIGDDYFKKLWKGSFFQEEKIDDYGNVISCKMHNLMHDLAQRVAGFEYFNVNDNAVDISERAIHASLNGTDSIEFPGPVVNARKLRTFLMTGEILEVTSRNFDKFASTCKRLRVLKLCIICESSDVLKNMGKLKRLRYLDLSGSTFRTLPNSICELQNLQTLKLNYCFNLEELPSDIKKLASLRHLENRCVWLKGMPLGIGQLTCIETLSLFVLGSSGGGGLSELEGLNNLRGELQIENLQNARNPTSISMEALYLKEKKYLQTLRLYWERETQEGYGDEDAALLERLQPNPYLKGLHIYGYGGARFPSWMVNTGNSLLHLVQITLEHCPRCECFPLVADQFRFLKVLRLSSLPSLKYIGDSSSSSSFKGNTLSGAGGWFPVLKEVSLRNLPELKEWTREVVVGDDGGKAKTESVAEQRKQLLSLNSLSKLIIIDCPRLTSMPLHPDVKELHLLEVSEVLIQSMTMAPTICPTTASTSLLPSSFTLSKLKSLDILFCNDLKSLPKGWLKNLTSIELLSIVCCNELESLSRERDHLTAPDIIKDLKEKELDLLEEEDDLQGFRSLHSLQLEILPKLRSLPKGLQHATNLKELSIRHCEQLTSLPRGLQNLSGLEELMISNCPELIFSDDDNDIPGFSSLQSLRLSGLPQLVSLPKVLQFATALKNLKIEECPGLMTLPNWLGSLTSLRQLEISDCDPMKSLPEGMRCLTALQELVIQRCLCLSETCQKETGKDWPKIAHIPKIIIDRQ